MSLDYEMWETTRVELRAPWGMTPVFEQMKSEINLAPRAQSRGT
jgi:hypothetical protein